MSRGILRPVALAILAFAIAIPVYATGDRPPINVRVKNPDRLGHNGILLSGQWALVLEFEVQGAVGIVDDGIDKGINNSALILRDPDGCINMQGWIAPGNPLNPIEGCTGPVDETFVRFTPDPLDTPGVSDTSGNTGIIDLQNALQDDAYDPGNLANLNRQYFDNGFGGAPSAFVGVGTEDATANPIDGYGYGVNDDFPGLYIWADIGTGRVTDESLDFVPDPDTTANKLRNMAGLVNGVFYTQLANWDRTSIVAVLNVDRGVLEPIIHFDFIDVNMDFGESSVGFLRSIDGGPVETILFPDSTPRDQDAAYEEVFASLEPFEVILRVAVVEGNAKPFIQDLDFNGKFNRRDIEMMGHTLLSDVQRYRVRAIQPEAIDTGPFKCPNGRVFKEGRLVETDTDPGIGCSTGSARSIVRPPR